MNIMNITHVQRISSPDVKNILVMMILSMKDSFRSFMCGRLSDELLEVHVHCEIPSLMIQQKKNEQDRREDGRSGADDPFNACVDGDGEYDVSWSWVMRYRTEKCFSASAYMWVLIIFNHAFNKDREEKELRRVAFMMNGN